jgi:hypothetical protein
MFSISHASRARLLYRAPCGGLIEASAALVAVQRAVTSTFLSLHGISARRISIYLMDFIFPAPDDHGNDLAGANLSSAETDRHEEWTNIHGTQIGQLSLSRG